MMTKTLVWTQTAMEDGRAPKPPEFYVNAGDKMELYIVREESEEKQMIYAVNKRTKEHRICRSLTQESDYAADDRWSLLDADADGWIPWEGWECPLADGQKCEIRVCHGDSVHTTRPEGWSWGHDNNALPITHYRPTLDSEPQIAEQEGGRVIDVTRISTAAESPFSRQADTKTEPPAWDGESRPPAGSCCEMRMTSGAWEAVKVEAYGREHVIFTDMAGEERVEYLRAYDFRPIRSEEDRVVEEMVRVWEESDAIVRKDFCRALYRAGYRKTGGEG